ncbi:LytTR family transcriptional regulator DNA-binding domain-containing protein [Vagococcus sp. BWB3-3]|uniref:LytTR family transcriptional regulator DNA-binding domain-containing protein n=1 Tax=Vagococcus allomyrinae TaxID=2794353 RepID=A0A940ST71_9ENTE|nr:LytTR family transcriptional regulator DNA-binding domain-containing protein [Vagococcus allomyrinae]MBP1040005.1 LytTR family transcriptional regulator DNA-binding domain-containing protein [Vagococcus allomyrinae]
MSLLTAIHLTKEKDQQTILKNIDLTIQCNQRIGIKMTHTETIMLFNLFEGRESPSSGSLKRERAVILSIRKEDQLYQKVSIRKYLATFMKISGNQLEMTNLAEDFSLIDLLDTPIKKLSVDQRQRVHLARVFLFNPQILLIESPLTDLTDEGIELYLKALKIFEPLQTALLFAASYTEELLLLGDEIYHYNKQIGLEKTDVTLAEEMSVNDEESLYVPSIFKIACKVADKTIFFDPIEVDFVESINSVSHISVSGEQFPTTLTMTELETKLMAFGFFRSHRSYLVNLQRVAELISYSKNSFTLNLKGNEGAKIPLSRSRLDEFKEIMNF